MSGKLSTAERLRVAGIAAPLLRSERPSRVVKLTGADGRVTGAADLRVVALGLCKRVEIEIDVLPGVRRQARKCVNLECGAVFVLTTRGHVDNNKYCHRCRLVRCSEPGCDMPAKAQLAARGRAKAGRPAYCEKHGRRGSEKAPAPPCAKCQKPVHRRGARSLAKIGQTVNCDECKRKPPALAICTTCGEPAKSQTATARWAAKTGKPIYCAKHGPHGTDVEIIVCHLCRMPVANQATARAAAKRGGGRVYCAKHPRGRTVTP